MSHMTVTIATGSALSLLLGSTWIHQAPTHSTRPRLSVSEGGWEGDGDIVLSPW